MISVGAIDCAAEVNMPTCREYEVRGQRGRLSRILIIQGVLIFKSFPLHGCVPKLVILKRVKNSFLKKTKIYGGDIRNIGVGLYAPCR